MTAAEFRELPETTKIAELIEGEIIVAPSPIKPHQDASGNVYFMLRQWLESGKISGTAQSAPMDVHLDDVNVPQPDVFWVSSDNQKCKLGDDGYWYGPPDLIMEVLSPGTARQDKVTKFALYERHGVREYWIADPAYQNVEVWTLAEEGYTRLGLFRVGDSFTSPVLKQPVDVSAIFAA
jgi:Uma2 family endonuclease